MSPTPTSNPLPGMYILKATDDNGCAAQLLYVRVPDITTTDISSYNELDVVKLYPNPNNGMVAISVKNNLTEVLVTVMDNSSSIIKQQLLSTESIVDLGEKGKGIYFVKITSDKNSKIIKLIVN